MKKEIKFRVFYKKETSKILSFLSWLFSWPTGMTYYRSYPPNTVGEHQQYLGLKDKNYKDIYEGDIVYFTSGVTSGIGKIVWELTQYSIEYKYYDKICYTFICPSQLEVIGNIFENPELMEKL